MDFRYLFVVFRSRWRALLLCTLACALAGLAAGFLLPFEHRATAMLLVRSADADGSRSARGEPAANTATALELLASPPVARRVVAATGLSLDHPATRLWGRPSDRNADPTDWLAAKLVRKTKFTASSDGNVIAVETTSPDAKLAAALANGFVQAYIQVSDEMQRAQAMGRLQQLERSLPHAQADVSAAQARMAEFRADHKDFNPDPRTDAGATLTAALAAQLAQAEAERSAGASAGVGAGSAGSAASPSLSVQNLQSDARRAEARLATLSAQYGPNHPAYQAAASELRTIRDALGAASRGATNASGSKAASLRAAIQQQQERASKVAALQEEYASFQRSLSAAESAVIATSNAIRQARVEMESPLARASVFAQAVPYSIDATHPLFKTVPVGAVLGLLLASIGLLIAEEASPRLRSTRSTMAALGLRTLARIPSAQAYTEEPHRTDPSRPDRIGRMGRLASHDHRRPASGMALTPAREAGRMLVSGDAGTSAGPASDAAPRALAGRAFGHDHLRQSPEARSAFIVELCPDHPVAEAIRALRSQLLLEWRGSARKRALSIQSLQDGDGKSFIATNLAIAFAQANLRTVLVDLNLRMPHLHALFDVEAPTGVSSILEGTAMADADALHTIDPPGRLSLLPAGPRVDNPQELISGQALETMLDDLERSFDVVILDVPSWDSGADAQLIAAAGGDAVIVARSDRTPLQRLHDMRDDLERIHVRTVGVAVNAY
ncbi:MAG: polysaccharide biosynthesis tyrosine autokinase [Ramlibacter sp.]